MSYFDYDLAILGGGPAGLTAGLYAARARLKTIMFEKVVLGGQILVTDWIENYPGFPEGISGYDLAQKMADQVARFNVPIKNEQVLGIEFAGRVKRLRLKDKTISVCAVIIATGASPNRLNIPGEETLLGKGVSYCATCDGPFYKGKRVAVAGGGNSAIQEAIFLTKFADKVFVIHRRQELRATKILQERAFANPKIKFILDSSVISIEGKNVVEKLMVENKTHRGISELLVDGLFVFVGIKANSGFLPADIKRDDRGFVLTDQSMETSVPGVYAAGDIRNTPLRQVVTAAGDAAIAAYSA
ncbi:MAG: thioredoxin-disulfide reductase, partial [Pseudomonadota bacterium]